MSETPKFSLETSKFSLGKLGLAVYGEDKVLSRPRQHKSSIVVPGRMVKGKWSTLHEVGNRQLVYEDEIDAHSFVRNFYNHMVMQAMDSDSLGDSAYSAGNLAIKRTDATIDTLGLPADIGSAGALDNGYRAGSGVDDFGIQAGRGTGAFSFNDFVLGTLIIEGTGTNQMNYVAMDDYTSANIVYNACTLKWTATYERFLNNNSGGSIDIEEVSLIDEHAGTALWYMMARDVLGCSMLTIADAGQLKVTYTISSPAFPS